MKLRGKIKFWSEAKGFGFIQTDGNADMFFHKDDLEGLTPEKFVRVNFELGTDITGRTKAVKVCAEDVVRA